jgi:hypothetical protein
MSFRACLRPRCAFAAAQKLSRGAFVVGGRPVVRLGERKIAMLAIPIHDYQAAALFEVSHRGAGQRMYCVTDLCLRAVFRSEKEN